jgi:TolA-binding protein
MDKLGGRKFVLTILMLIIGSVVEVKSANGMSAVFAGFLAAMLAAFSTANVIATKATASMSAKDESGGELAETVTQLDNVNGSKLESIESQLNSVQDTILAIGQTTLNTQKLIQGALGATPR